MEQFPVNLDMYSLVVGAALPLLISVIIKCQWSARIKMLVSLGMMVVVSFGHLWFMGGWSLADLPGSFLRIGFICVTTYMGFWRSSGVTDWIEQNINGGTEQATCDPVK